jgi:hypothetical protein
LTLAGTASGTTRATTRTGSTPSTSAAPPWGWRDAVVTDIDGHWLTVEYLQEPAVLRLWHHEQLGAEIAVGGPVRVHEQYYVIGGPFGWLNVVVRRGLGPVPAPPKPAAWAAEMTGGVQDLATGRALALDHTAVTS